MSEKFDYSFSKLENYLISENFKGYDPYDTLNSFIPFKILGNFFSVLATQIQKRNPINIRRFIGIKKEINPKAFALFLSSYSILFKKTKNPIYKEKADFFYSWLKNNTSSGYSGISWGYNFPWSGWDMYLNSYVPSAVVTGFVVKGLYDYYQITKKVSVIKLMENASIFIDNELEKHIDHSGVSFSYTPIKKDICYNASLLAAEALAKTSSLSKKYNYYNLVNKAVDFVIHKQYDDGRWNYSIDLSLKKEDKQIDFHQGYILESIYEIKKVLKIDNDNWDKSISLGLDFYLKKQFNKNGRSLWRYPKKFPIDIHNQAQGIITFYKLKNYNDKSLKFSQTILDWTINNMQSKNGYFFYRINRLLTDKTSYIRWNNAWMFLSLAYIK